MALPAGTWKNSDGLVVKFHGQYDITNPPFVNRLRSVNNEGPTKWAVMDFDLETVGASTTWFPFDLTNDGTADGFSDEENYLPAGCTILRAFVKTTEIAAGGTSFAIGRYSISGSTLDDDGIVTDTEGVIASMDHVGDIIIANGVDVGDTSGGSGPAVDSYLAVKTTGTFTAGKGTLYIEYV